MPDKICRICGEELIGYSQCFECKKPIQHICIKCGKKTIERLHLRCFAHTKHDLSMPASISIVE